MSHMKAPWLLAIIIVVLVVEDVYGHGRLVEPPSRSSMWRYGFPTPPNYNDNQLYCGGFQRQQKNGGKCGVCGDPWDAPHPQANEAGGKYGNGIIVRHYKQGDVMNIGVQITAHHQGWFEFRMCVNNDVKKRITHACLNKHLLQLADGSGTRYKLPNTGNMQYNIKVKLPAEVTCTQCVIQWKYHAGNSWGVDPVTGKGCVGCGPQEEFYGCADVAIKEDGTDPKPPALTMRPRRTTVRRQTERPTKAPVVKTTRADKRPTDAPVNTDRPQVTPDRPVADRCTFEGDGVHQGRLDGWCVLNCKRGYCPVGFCRRVCFCN